ncbi:hypothetical protein AB0K48_31595, partial [Nonomuraea sp. NPDC055795]
DRSGRPAEPTGVQTYRYLVVGAGPGGLQLSYTKAFEAKDGVKYYVCIAKIDAATCTGDSLSWIY